VKIIMYLRISQKQGGHLRKKLGAHQERALSSVVKRPRNEADHSPPSSAEVKNRGVIPPHPICLHGMVLNKLITWTTLSVTSDALKSLTCNRLCMYYTFS
jgi:hypothetical protein